VAFDQPEPLGLLTVRWTLGPGDAVLPGSAAAGAASPEELIDEEYE
jgi:hypothetical protein